MLPYRVAILKTMEARIAVNTSRGVGEDSDVLVRLLSSQYPLCHAEIPHHSHILRTRSDFFAARLSERWTPTSSTTGSLFTIDITIHDDDAAIYKRCLQLINVPRTRLHACRPFSGVNDALRMFGVATKLLFHDCINACMEYLEMLPSWTIQEEQSIRASLSSLEPPPIHPDLAARLCLPNHGIRTDEPVRVMRRMLLQVLSTACKPHTLPELQIIDLSQPIPDSIILKVWNLPMDVLKAWLESYGCYSNQRSPSFEVPKSALSILSWLLRRLLDLQVADTVVNAFSKDAKLASLVREYMKNNKWEMSSLSCGISSDLKNLSSSIIHAVENGDVLLPRVSRLTLITTWLPTMQVFPSSLIPSNDHLTFKVLINSLPVCQREQIFKDLMGPHYKVLFESLFAPWCDSLREAHFLLAEGEETSLVTADDHS